MDWTTTLIRLERALCAAPEESEVLLYLGRVHFEELKRFAEQRDPEAKDLVSAVHCQLRETPYPMIVTRLPIVDGVWA